MHLDANNFQVCIAPILKFISVLLKLQGSRATPKHWPIEKIFGTDFFLHNWKGATTSFQTFIFLGHTNPQLSMRRSHPELSLRRSHLRAFVEEVPSRSFYRGCPFLSFH